MRHTVGLAALPWTGMLLAHPAHCCHTPCVWPCRSARDWAAAAPCNIPHAKPQGAVSVRKGGVPSRVVSCRAERGG
eukprot:365355-Chlamydomonas_euryale.AAC.5